MTCARHVFKPEQRHCAACGARIEEAYAELAALLAHVVRFEIGDTQVVKVGAGDEWVVRDWTYASLDDEGGGFKWVVRRHADGRRAATLAEAFALAKTPA